MSEKDYAKSIIDIIPEEKNGLRQYRTKILP